MILLNNDTIISRETISSVVEAYQDKRDSGIYGGRIFYYDRPDIIWFDGGSYNTWLARATHNNHGKTSRKDDLIIKDVEFITFCFVLIPKKILNKVGLLDECYFMYVEDLDYCYRVKKAGYKLFYVPKTTIYHKVGASYEG